jgi:hypothetical protein
MSDMILTTFDWVPEMPRGYRPNLWGDLLAAAGSA